MVQTRQLKRRGIMTNTSSQPTSMIEEQENEIIEKENEPAFQRRYLTESRVSKVNGFIRKCEVNPKRFGVTGSPKWYQGILDAINEPEIVTIENVREWMVKRSNIFKTKTPTSKRKRRTNYSYEDNKYYDDENISGSSSSSSSSDMFTPIKAPQIETNKIEVDEVISSWNVPQTPPNSIACDDEQSYQISKTQLEEYSLSKKCLELQWGSGEHYVNDENIPYLPIPMIEQSIQSENNSVGMEKFDSGISSSLSEEEDDSTDFMVLTKLQQSIKEIPNYFTNTQTLMVDAGDFFNLASKTGSFEVIQEETSITPKLVFSVAKTMFVPNSRVEIIQDIITSYNNMLDNLNALENAFKVWNEFLIQQNNNMLINETLKELRFKFDHMQTEIINHVCEN